MATPEESRLYLFVFTRPDKSPHKLFYLERFSLESAVNRILMFRPTAVWLLAAYVQLDRVEPVSRGARHYGVKC